MQRIVSRIEVFFCLKPSFSGAKLFFYRVRTMTDFLLKCSFIYNLLNPPFGKLPETSRGAGKAGSLIRGTWDCGPFDKGDVFASVSIATPTSPAASSSPDNRSHNSTGRNTSRWPRPRSGRPSHSSSPCGSRDLLLHPPMSSLSARGCYTLSG